MNKNAKPVVLVIDDEQTYLNVISETLKQRNFKILQALNGKMGCMVARKFIPDIIITDWEMPEMNGIEAIAELKREQMTKDIPIIMCTGIMVSSEHLDTALNAGAVDFIRKPVEPIELLARINSALSIATAINQIKSKNAHIEEQKFQIEQKNQKLEELVATKDKFFGIIAHDLKNPLYAIHGLTKMLLERESDIDKVREMMKQIGITAREAFKLLENLLNWARLQQGQIVMDLQMIPVKLIIAEVLQLLDEVAKAKNIKIKTIVNDDCKAYCDKDSTKTIVRNLLSNAIKYTHKDGEIVITVNQNEDNLEFSIKDSGVGISPDRIEYLFRIDKNVSTPGTAEERGTGLGLILCKELVEKQGGQIRVESELQKGSTFKFTLPLSS